LYFYKNENHFDLIAKFTGTEFEDFIIEGDSFWIYFFTDEDTNKWGYEFTVTEL